MDQRGDKMPNTTYNIRIDKQIRDEADALYKSMGLTLSSAINLFLKQSIIQGRLPINDVITEPHYVNSLLNDAFEIDTEIMNGTAKIYSTPDELFKEWVDENKRIILTRTPSPKQGTLEYLFKDYNGGDFNTELIDLGETVGNERW